MNSLRSLVLTAFGFTSTAVVGAAGTSDRVYAEDGVALRGFDPVALLVDGQLEQGSPQLMATHRGARFQFASSANREAFEADPTAMSPQFGGWCTVGVSDGVYWPGDPEFHQVRDGKLYIFAGSPALDWYHSDPGTFIRRAELVWEARGNLSPSPESSGETSKA